MRSVPLFLFSLTQSHAINRVRMYLTHSIARHCSIDSPTSPSRKTLCLSNPRRTLITLIFFNGSVHRNHYLSTYYWPCILRCALGPHKKSPCSFSRQRWKSGDVWTYWGDVHERVECCGRRLLSHLTQKVCLRKSCAVQPLHWARGSIFHICLG